jgi:hypothetical protein
VKVHHDVGPAPARRPSETPFAANQANGFRDATYDPRHLQLLVQILQQPSGLGNRDRDQERDKGQGDEEGLGLGVYGKDDGKENGKTNKD